MEGRKMENDGLILERLDRLEDKITPMTETARAIGDLREELAPRVNEAVHALIRELADVEADFQLEDLLFLAKKALRNVKNLSYSLDQLKNIIDFALNVEPLLKSSVPQLILYLDGLERHGVFRLVNMLVEVLMKIGNTYSAEEMDQLGAGMVHLVGTLKKLSDPQSLAFLDRAAELPARLQAADIKETGPIGLLWAFNGKEARQGLGMLVEATKGLGALKNPA
jgi:uncharacterized protein YjgD (DUF1641 family)